MSESHGDLDVLVAAGDRSFGSAVVDAVETTAEACNAAHVETGADALTRSQQTEVDGAVVDERISEPVTVVDRLTSEGNIPVVVLTDPAASGDTVTRAIEAGATDVFPRTTTTAQYELVVDRIASESDRPGEDTVTAQPFREVFQNASDGMVVQDPETGEILDVNERFCEMTGFSRDRLVGATVDLLNPETETDSYERATQLIRQAREDGDSLFEWEQRHRDGHTFPVEVHLTLVELHGRQRVLASVRDVTERKRREREYEQIFNMAGDGIVIHEPESGEIVDANRQVADLLGYDRQAFFDQPMSEFQATEEGVSAEQARERIRTSAETGGQEFEWPLETADGETVWVRARHETGQIDGQQRVVALLQDITKRRRREREFQQVFNSVNDIIAVHNGTTGELIHVNRRMCELTGYNREQVLERGAEGLVRDHPDQDYAPSEIPDIIERVMDGEDVEPYEQALETKDGDVIWIEVNPTRALIGGEERFVAISRDITERRRREREYEQIFNGVRDSMVVWDPETLEMLEVNDAYLDMLGYKSRAEIREQGVTGLSVTEEGYTRQRGREIHKRVAETGDPETVEWQGETRDCERVWTEVKITPAVIGGKQRTVSIQRDITERKRREQMVRSLYDATERLQRAETREATCETTVQVARDVLDLPLTAFWLHRETDEEPVLEPIAGTDPVQELDPLWFRPGDDEYEAFRENEVRVHDPSEQFPENPLDASILLPIGDHGLLAAGKVGVEEYDEFVVDAARTLAGHVRTALDRVERAQAVRRSERRFRLIAERIDEVIYLAEPDFSEMLYVNPAYEEIFGGSVETLYSDATAFLEAIDERDRDRFESDFREMLSEIDAGDPAESYEFEFRVRQPGGEVRWVRAAGYAVELSGEDPRFVGIVDDITERKRREQRLEVFNRILRHNLRNQLDVIRSHAEVLADERTTDHADRIIAAVDELAGMGTRARRSDRIMSMDETPTETDLSEVVRETVTTAGSGHAGVSVTAELPEQALLKTSEDAVTIAVENAFENAIEHATSSVTLAIEGSPEGYHIVVDDDGPGIPDEELVPIEAGTETNLRHGRGLGLWQLRWSVDKINGELSFDTTEGTTVTIVVPDQDQPDRLGE